MDLFGTATQLLDLVVDQLTAQGVPIPERVYVAPGLDVAFDCEQLTVHLSRIISNFQGADTPYPVITHAIIRKSAEYYITLCRCVPSMNDDGSAPSPESLSAAANVVMGDMMGLRKAIETIEHQHLLVPRNVPVTLGQANTIGPLGGIATSQIMYSLELIDNPEGWR
jgi:hypothetical protein